jgi:hypothetical protein
VLLPVLMMALLTRSLRYSAPRYPNYRGVLVYNGLGIVWFVWLLCFWMGAHILSIAGFEQPNWISYLVPVFPLISGSCIFGLLDDWVGDHFAKGFRGHLRFLYRGILTTGGIKMIGIGLLSLFTALSLYWDGAQSLLHIIAATCVMALTANFLNLFDLRPGRAGKVYLLGLLLALVSLALSPLLSLAWPDICALMLAGLGPLLAVWRFDLGEEGMLGDAGANSMGAFLGFIFATALPVWLLLPLAVVLLAFNIALERVSFSDLVQDNKVLRYLDSLGRKDVVE